MDGSDNETHTIKYDYRAILAEFDRARARPATSPASANASNGRIRPILFRPRGRKPMLIYETAKLQHSAIFSVADSRAAQHVKLLDERYKVVVKNEYGYENVTQALERDDSNADDLLEILLKRGRVDANCCNAFGFTLLHWACSREIAYSRSRPVQLLIENGADVNAVDRKFGRTPLHCAVKSGNADIVVLLLNKGAKMAVQEGKGMFGQTAMHLAAESGSVSLKAAYILLKASRGEAARWLNLEGETPLHTAAVWNHAEIAKALFQAIKSDDQLEYLSQKSNVNSGETPLMLARKSHSHHMVKFLIAELELLRRSRNKTAAKKSMNKQTISCELVPTVGSNNVTSSSVEEQNNLDAALKQQLITNLSDGGSDAESTVKKSGLFCWNCNSSGHDFEQCPLIQAHQIY